MLKNHIIALLICLSINLTISAYFLLLIEPNDFALGPIIGGMLFVHKRGCVVMLIAFFLSFFTRMFSSVILVSVILCFPIHAYFLSNGVSILKSVYPEDKYAYIQALSVIGILVYLVTIYLAAHCRVALSLKPDAD
ncbi:hypothetical protein PMI41_03486 [Phyllobacterium sp. YR531]|nr:hypothetical protein PMI41_03486 [Phyllobacterium sp. YR531]